jgi:hypothetical protein
MSRISRGRSRKEVGIEDVACPVKVGDAQNLRRGLTGARTAGELGRGNCRI